MKYSLCCLIIFSRETWREKYIDNETLFLPIIAVLSFSIAAVSTLSIWKCCSRYTHFEREALAVKGQHWVYFICC